ncbi:hypothetical protein HETIRDRAFT_316372 [Heterobasidion irregulare TC 32-1]|uniref:Protein ARV n=1 Tax=Heterobasidion irregulare (strain TC 32-1) TaxID=747525 RepID=W4KAH3_HETIT|nr:uncharacterized protein HETIRDRAFT_316372 [Heterobasidion irregulare TC 32-1]ETW82773.1 hypothetical protein HETIRDRAFT_316372 [Heterobasidion irregulare TC 32-1]
MPLCTTCTQPLPHLYIVYQSAHNVRLERCTTCHEFADPYVTHDLLVIILDLILLKRGVYRHLLFNRGSKPRQVDQVSSSSKGNGIRRIKSCGLSESQARWWLTLRLGAVIVLVDSCKYASSYFLQAHLTASRILYNPNKIGDPWASETMRIFIRILLGCCVENVVFHIGITLSSSLVLIGLNWFSVQQRKRKTKGMLIQSRYASLTLIRCICRYSHIPLCLLYSSLSKFFLLFLLSVWGHPKSPAQGLPPPQYEHTIRVENPALRRVWEALDDDKLDREWVVRNVLGGMAAGFGLRVVLDCHPFFTTIVILSGWGIKTVVASVVGGWVGGKQIEETWLAYSIP